MLWLGTISDHARGVSRVLRRRMARGVCVKAVGESALAEDLAAEACAELVCGNGRMSRD